MVNVEARNRQLRLIFNSLRNRRRLPWAISKLMSDYRIETTPSVERDMTALAVLKSIYTRISEGKIQL